MLDWWFSVSFRIIGSADELLSGTGCTAISRKTTSARIISSFCRAQEQSHSLTHNIRKDILLSISNILCLILFYSSFSLFRYGVWLSSATNAPPSSSQVDASLFLSLYVRNKPYDQQQLWMYWTIREKTDGKGSLSNSRLFQLFFLRLNDTTQRIIKRRKSYILGVRFITTKEKHR